VSGKVCVVGSFMADLVVTAPRRPQPGETLRGHDFAIYPGGKGYNQAVASRRAGAAVSFVGMLGKDAFGDMFVADLEAEGIDTTHVRRHAEVGTGVGLPVVEDDGQNSIIIIPRANLELTPADVEDAEGAIAGADVLLLQLELTLETTAAAARIARAAGTTVLLNPAPFATLPAEILKDVDVLVPNEGEARAFVGAPDETPIADVAALLRDTCHGALVVTLGGDGVLVSDAAGDVVVRSHRVPVVDTVGAGDVFCGALGSALAEGLDLPAAVAWANAAGALAVGRRGGSTSAPFREEIRALLDSRS